ncbi:MAG: RsmE family RNA methyltransferase [Sphaerochaetaceae bacterium]|jgi:16S rRNA (uracil1498-N3)-methyltransferase
MRQYALPRSFAGEETFKLSEKEARYLEKVLRFSVGTEFSGIDAYGGIWDLTLLPDSTIRCSKAMKGMPKTTSDTLPSFQGPFPRLHLYQCLCKGKKDETIVRMATETGVWAITFVQSRFCTVDLSEKSGKALASRNERLEAIIKEAIQQSGSSVPTTLTEATISLKELAHTAKGTKLFFHQDILEQKSLPDLLSGSSRDEEISILVGSEGGLSDEECNTLLDSGFHPVLLKTNILRAETAALYAISACQVILTEHLTTGGES